MSTGILIILVLLLFYFSYDLFYKHSVLNTQNVRLCTGQICESYNVHRNYPDQKEAAKILEEITKRNKMLFNYLRGKYLGSVEGSVEPTKNGRIDIIGGSVIHAFSASDSDIRKNEYIQERVRQLFHNYDSDEIYEISPLNTMGTTSYTQEKKTLVLCLRKREKNRLGGNELHDINTIMFVVLHELSHMMSDTWGHKDNFWVLFKFVLQNAIECGVYAPIDYRANPVLYCGLLLQYNPIYDSSL